MSAYIATEYKCFACQSDNQIRIRKPKPFQPVIAQDVCKACASGFMISFKLIAGEPGKMVYGFLVNNMRLSEDGARQFNLRHKDKEENQPNNGVGATRGES